MKTKTIDHLKPIFLETAYNMPMSVSMKIELPYYYSWVKELLIYCFSKLISGLLESKKKHFGCFEIFAHLPQQMFPVTYSLIFIAQGGQRSQI